MLNETNNDALCRTYDIKKMLNVMNDDNVVVKIKLSIEQ